jgi:CspA family cold shock protein
MTTELGGPDIFLHMSVMEKFGQTSVINGSLIEVLITETQRGFQAEQVLSITPPQSDVILSLPDMGTFSPEDIAKYPIELARVKWFNKIDGFGFANLFQCKVDIFIHAEVLRRAGLSDLKLGEAIGLRIADRELGRTAIEVVSW